MVEEKLMIWEYKRVLFNANKTIQDRRYDKQGKLINPNIDDSVEELFNSLGTEGWMLKTAVNLDSGVDLGPSPFENVIEYIFYREKKNS